MKPTLLLVREVAQELGVSAQSIRRAYWSGGIPAYRVNKMLRFDFEQVQHSFLANGLPGLVRRAIGGVSRRRAPQNAPVG